MHERKDGMSKSMTTNVVTNDDMSPLAVTHVPASHVEHRQATREFIEHDPDIKPWHREHLTRLYAHWDRMNETHFGGALVSPALRLAEPSAPQVHGQCATVSGIGARLEIRIRPSLLRGTHPHVRGGAEWAEGRARFAEDVLLHEMVHQWQQEVTGTQEDSYHGHGPTFRDKANAIGASLGLAPVRIAKRRGKDAGLPSCAQWPHCVRPADYYFGAVVPASDATGEESADELARRMRKAIDALNDVGRYLDHYQGTESPLASTPGERPAPEVLRQWWREQLGRLERMPGFFRCGINTSAGMFDYEREHEYGEWCGVTVRLSLRWWNPSKLADRNEKRVAPSRDKKRKEP